MKTHTIKGVTGICQVLGVLACMCDVGVDPSRCEHWLSKKESSAVLFIGGVEEFSMSWYDTSRIGTPQLLAQFAARMVAQMRKTENYNLKLDSNIRLML